MMLGFSIKNSPYLIAVLIGVAALLVPLSLFRESPIDVEAVISSLHRIEASYKPLPQPNAGPLVMVGFGGCTDITIDALVFFQALGVDPNKPAVTESLSQFRNEHIELNTLDDVVEEFTRLFILGAAAERYVKNQTLFNNFIEFAMKMVADPDDIRVTAMRGFVSLGGNAPVMARRLDREGAEVSLVSRISSREKNALPPSVRVLSAPPTYGLPETPQSDIHLVLEFDRGVVWRNHSAPRANRFILIRDEENPRLSSLWEGLMPAWRSKFGNRAKQQPGLGGEGESLMHPDLFVIGGLQTMDGALFSPDIRPERLGHLKDFLSLHLSMETLVHFEMASFVDTAFVVNLTKTILPYVDSIGMNEQELPNLVSLLSRGQALHEASPSTPRIAVMLDQLREIWSILLSATSPRVGAGQRRLSRLHLHTLGYQVIMARRPVDPVKARLFEQRAKEAQMYYRSANASLIAHRHTCASASMDLELTRLLMDDSFAVTADPDRWPAALLPSPDKKSIRRIKFNSRAPVSCWFEAEPSGDGDPTSYQNPRASQTAAPIETRVQICVAPVPVCRNVTRTVGGGDNISAGALRAQI